MEREKRLWPGLALVASLCACAAFRGPRLPEPAAETVRLEADGSGPDAAAAEAAARRRALAQALDLFLSTSAQQGLQDRLVDDGARFVQAATVVGSSRHAGRQERRVALLLRYRSWRDALIAQGLIDPPAIAGRPALLLRADGPALERALSARLSEAGFAVGREGAAAEVRASASLSSAPAAGARLSARTAEVTLKAAWTAGAPSPAQFFAGATAYELSSEDAAAKALDDAARAVAAKLRSWTRGRLEERSKMTVLVVSVGPDLDRVRDFIDRLRGMPHVAAASLELVAGRDARLRVWTERLSADELALELRKMPGYHLIVRNVEAPYGWIEVDTEDAF